MNNTVWSSWTTDTSINVPQGVLQPGTSYQWQIVAWDCTYSFYSSNKSFSPWKPLIVDKFSPYFSYAIAYDRNDPDGHFTGLNIRVGDGNGTIPDSITSLTVTDPGGFSYAFKPSNYSVNANEYSYRTPGTPLEGLYTFTVTNNEGNTAVTYHHHKQGGGTLPLLNESSFEISGNTLTPTISWSTIAEYPQHLYYRVRIIDDQGLVVYQSSSPYSPYSYRVISPGYLVSGKSYKYRVEAMDTPHLSTYDNRTNSSYHPLSTLQLHVSIRGSGDGLYDDVWNGSKWNGWSSLGGYLVSTPAAVNANGLLQLFVVGWDNALYTKSYDGSTWSGWSGLGGVIYGPPVAVNYNELPYVFVVGKYDHALWQMYWDGSKWSDWTYVGGYQNFTPGAASINDGGVNELHLLAVGWDNALYQCYWDGSKWSDWVSLGGVIVTKPAATEYAGQLEVFVTGQDDAIWQNIYNEKQWGGWTSLGGLTPSAPAAATHYPAVN